MELAIRTMRSVAVVSTGSWIIVNILNGHHLPCPCSSLRISFNASLWKHKASIPKKESKYRRDFDLCSHCMSVCMEWILTRWLIWFNSCPLVSKWSVDDFSVPAVNKKLKQERNRARTKNLRRLERGITDLQWLGQASMRSWDIEELKPRTFESVVFSPSTFPQKTEDVFCFCSVLQVKLYLIYTKTMCALLLDL